MLPQCLNLCLILNFQAGNNMQKGGREGAGAGFNNLLLLVNRRKGRWRRCTDKIRSPKLWRIVALEWGEKAARANYSSPNNGSDFLVFERPRDLVARHATQRNSLFLRLSQNDDPDPGEAPTARGVSPQDPGAGRARRRWGPYQCEDAAEEIFPAARARESFL